MKTISFAWTSPALIAGQKSVTRRGWDDEYARRFRRGEVVMAYDRAPRHAGQPIARLRILSVTHERDADTPDSDYGAEGFTYLQAHPELLPKGKRLAYLAQVSWEAFEEWRQAGGTSWVCRFEVLDILQPEGTG